jgi:hypothetical protein
VYCPHPPQTVAEPQAGAQVPSQDADFAKQLESHFAIYGTWQKCSCRFHRAIKVGNDDEPKPAIDPDNEIRDLTNALQTIRDYVLAAQQTPITREDMHDHLKALTVFDEAHGLYNLVLSETGGGK